MEIKPLKKNKDGEKDVEKYLIKRCRSISCTVDGELVKGTSYKFTSPLRRNVPDRLCLFPRGLIVFVECKSKGKKPTAAQVREGNRLRALGFLVIFVDSHEMVDTFITSMKGLYLKGGKFHESTKV